MKTIKQWLNELPEPYRTQALENAEKSLLDAKEHSICGALLASFEWEKTKQGFEYWDQLYDSLPN